MFRDLAVFADDYEPADEEDNASNTLILDADDTGGNVTLQFGESLAEFLRWNSGNASFDLSDETLTLDASNAGAGANVSIIANQGSDNDGELRYNASTNQWELSNDGGSFNAIATGAGVVATDLPVVQARRDTNYTLTNAFVDITLNNTDVENDSSVVEHDNTNTDDIDIKEDGLYLIYYRTQVEVGGASLVRAFGQVRLNDTSVIAGTDAEVDIWYDSVQNLTASAVTSLSNGDFITLQLSKETTADAATAIADTVLEVMKLEGIEGPTGPAGPSQDFEGVYTTDAGNNLDTSNAIFTVTTGTNDFVVDSNDWNVTAAGDLDAASITTTGTVDFSSATSIDIPHTNASIFTVDNDETGNPDTDIDIVAEQGTESNGTLRYDDGDNRWKLSNDGGSFTDIHPASVFYTYDNTGAQVITGTEVTLNFDSVTETITDSDYTFTDGADTIEFNETGTYKISIQVGTDDTNTSGGARATNEITFKKTP